MIDRAASPPAKRGQRQRQKTRAALLVAGQQLFAAQSVDSVTIDEIVGAAEVAKGSFYNHFADKESFASAIFSIVQGDVEFHIFSNNQDVEDPPQRIARALCTVLVYARDHPERLQALMGLAERRTSWNSALNRGVSADVRRGLEQRRLSGVDLEVGVLLVVGLVGVVVRHAMSDETTIGLHALAASVSGALLRGLGVEAVEAGEIAARAAADIMDAPATAA